MIFKKSNLSHLALLYALVFIGFSTLVNADVLSPTKISQEQDFIHLENSFIAVKLAVKDGSIRSISDRKLGVDYSFQGVGLEFSTLHERIKGLRVQTIETRSEKVILHFTKHNFSIALTYSLAANDHFIEKHFEIKENDKKSFHIKDLVLEKMSQAESFNEIHFHDDNTIWHCPINLFLRSEKGGCFAGLAYPYWNLEQQGKKGFSLGFSANYQVPAGQVFTSEKYFLGVYRNEGIYRYSQGPYPGSKPNPYISFTGAGVTQHFKGRMPAQAVESEVLDWGEVWAMQKFMRHALPDLPLPEKGYWVWQNGWWAKLWDIKTEILDQLKQSGIHDIMTAHTWYGRGNHPINPPYLNKMRTQSLGFPKDKGVAGMPGPAGPTAGLHSKHDEVSLDSFISGQFTPEFMAPPAMEAFYNYGKKIGVHVSSFSLPGLYFEDRPEWASLQKDGKVTEYLFGAKIDCPASDEFMEHHRKLLEHVFEKYQPRWWGFDGRWLSYWEVPKYRPGSAGLGFDTCYAKNHGHPPGDNLYKEWKNIEKLLSGIRKKYPFMCLEMYYGMKRGGPWAMRYFNADENYYETNGVTMNRFQAWHNGNDRFRPVYKNMAAVIGKSPKDFQRSLLSTISVTSYAKFGEGFHGLALEENRQFLKKWRAWATKNHAYLKVKRDLFACPGFKPIDGSAHIIKDRGFFFLFSPAHKGEDVRASIPINHWLQLDESAGQLYQIKEVYPNKGKLLAIVPYGEDFFYDIPKNAEVILSIEPTTAGSKPFNKLDSAKEGQIIEAFSSEGSEQRLPASDRHYSFDSIDAKTATSANQLSSATPARLSGQTLTGGVNDKALQFKPGNKGVLLGDLGMKSPATISFWIKSDKLQSDGRLLSQLEGPSQQRGALRIVGGNLQVWNASDWPVVVSGLSHKNVWQHLVIVYNQDGTVSGYLNGRKSHTVSASFDFKGIKAGLGSPFLGQWGDSFIGILDDVRIRQGALSEKEIHKLIYSK
ncbi:LamG domain-containing protein [Lentisphaera profundi]|uniref:LamG domain-containing protein n=1 Tax=Lentisphaera profundi TaxID=1658616 RepID=A0ABY7VSK6_9BACT|nr:LamG domain-containing protein [Lentisphaera profundi]WDE97191.1 LamG domain-containing protein [Lentisphaera profundi]